MISRIDLDNPEKKDNGKVVAKHKKKAERDWWEKKERHYKKVDAIEWTAFGLGVAMGLFMGVGMPRIMLNNDAVYGKEARIQERQDYEQGKISEEQHQQYCVKLENCEHGINIASIVVTPLAVLGMACFNSVSAYLMFDDRIPDYF